MTKEELIIALIQQDFKHCQLVSGIQNLGFDTDGIHYLNILDIVIKLMEFDDTDHKLIDSIYNTYFGIEQEVIELPISYDSKELISIATKCYHQILAIGNDKMNLTSSRL